MSWQFYGGTTDPGKMTRESMMFAFALEPKKLATMMDDLDDLPAPEAKRTQANIKKLEENKRGIIVGRERLAAMNKRVGERIKIYSMNYKGIDLEFDIVGTFPDGRYNQTAAMNRDYLNDALDDYPRTHAGQRHHPMADASLNLVWLRVADSTAFHADRGAGHVVAEFHQPGGEMRNGVVGDRLVSRRLQGSDLGRCGGCFAGDPVHAVADFGQRDQHQRPRAADGGRGVQGARLSPRAHPRRW